MTVAMIKMTDLNLNNQRVLIREDLNVPIKAGNISSDKRIRASLDTINLALNQGAHVMVMSHLGRPEEGVFDKEASLAPVAERLSELLQCPVTLASDWLENDINTSAGTVTLLENVRFNVGEKSNDDDLAKKMAAKCDVFVMDAFGTAHRAQASTHGIAKYAAIACAGPLLVNELEALGKIIDKPARPLLAVVGGSKVSTKLTILQALSQQVDQLIVGGGIANTFIAAAGYAVGKSLYEPDLLDQAKTLIEQAKQKGSNIPIPVDVVTAKTFSADATAEIKAVADVAEDDLILDIGPQTAAEYGEIIAKAGTIMWNGPVGVFEIPAFAEGTKTLANDIAQSSAFSVAGGGDTLAAIDQFNISDKVSYISTGGGAFLEFIEGKKLPAIEILEKRYSQSA